MTCPHCGAKSKVTISTSKMDLGGYLAEWKRDRDDLEIYMADIDTISVTGESIIEPMRTTKNVLFWSRGEASAYNGDPNLCNPYVFWRPVKRSQNGFSKRERSGQDSDGLG